MTRAPLPLYPGAASCVGSGYCCKQRPCGFGKVVSESDNSCMHLTPVETNGKHQRYTCGIYDYIITQKGWEHSPAFGAGCCSPLFNSDRNAIIREIENDRRSISDVARTNQQHHQWWRDALEHRSSATNVHWLRHKQRRFWCYDR